MKQADLNAISEIVGKYGFADWSLVGFTPDGNYKVYSYFTDPSVMPVFKAILISMLKTLEDYLERNRNFHEDAVHHVGEC